MLLELNFTLILFAFSFLVFIYLLNMTLFKPVGKVIEDRKNLIENNYTKAKELTEKVTGILENYKDTIKTVKHEAQVFIQEAINGAKKKKEEKILILLTALNKQKEEALIKLKEEKDLSMKELEGKIKILTNLITSKVLGTENSLVGTH